MIDRIIAGVSLIATGVGIIIATEILVPPPTLPKLTAVFCTTMANVPPDYNNIIFTIVGFVFIVVGVIISSRILEQ